MILGQLRIGARSTTYAALLCNKLFTAARSLKRHKNKQHLLIAESQDDTDNPLVAAHDIAFIIA